MSEQGHKCEVCSGRGYFRCDCWPGDCICGQDDVPCDECGGFGWIDDFYDGPDEFDPFTREQDPARRTTEGDAS